MRGNNTKYHRRRTLELLFIFARALGIRATKSVAEPRRLHRHGDTAHNRSILTGEAKTWAQRCSRARSRIQDRIVPERQRPTRRQSPQDPSRQIRTEQCRSTQNSTREVPVLSIFAEAEADLGGSGSRDVGRSRAGRILGSHSLSGGPLKNAPMGAPRAPQIQPSNWAVGDFKCFVNRLDSALSNRMRAPSRGSLL